MLEINLRQSFTATVTTTPQMLLASREAGDNRQYLKIENKSGSTTVMYAPDVEYNAATFSTSTGGEAVAPGVVMDEFPGGVPSDAFWFWTTSGTASAEIQEG